MSRRSPTERILIERGKEELTRLENLPWNTVEERYCELVTVPLGLLWWLCTDTLIAEDFADKFAAYLIDDSYGEANDLQREYITLLADAWFEGK